MQVDLLLEGLNLAPIQIAIAILGALLCVYVAQLTSSSGEDAGDPPAVRWGYRATALARAIVFLWIAAYTDAKTGWQPWPPYFALLLVIVCGLIWRVVALHKSIKRREADARSLAGSLQKTAVRH